VTPILTPNLTPTLIEKLHPHPTAPIRMTPETECSGKALALPREEPEENG
jgi:hypothetical protein